jgi:ribosomal protein S27AE
MVYEQYDFTRNPVVEDQVFFLESKCIRCGSSVLARSVEEILEKEKRHRAQCTVIRASGQPGGRNSK